MPANQETRLAPSKKIKSLKGRVDILNTLIAAAETFVHSDKEGNIEIWAASRDWFFEEWGRDTYLALPGILLATEHFNEAENNFKHFAEYERDGLIPNRIENDGEILYNTVDASMWYIQALKKYFEYTHNEEFMQEILPTAIGIIENYKQGTSFHRYGKEQIIEMDPEDGLIKNTPQATWMDADQWGKGDAIITPRNGKCVEINALWYSNLHFIAGLSPKHAKEYKRLAHKVKKSFNKKFWNKSEKALYDVIEGDPHKGAIRPNQIFAVSHGEDLLSKTRQKNVFMSCKRDLLTPGGLRTLSPRDSNYIGHYNTYDPMHIKDQAYHQGTVWPWLIGPYCDTLAKVRKLHGKSQEKIQKEIEAVIAPPAQFCIDSEYKSLPEVFSGDPPHEPGGTTSQAWSVAEVLRTLTEHNIITD